MRMSKRSYRSKKRLPFRAKRKFGRRGNTRFKTQVRVGKGFPKKMTMTHKYSQLVNMVSTVGGNTQYFFSCNGMFDPDATGTGHQPYYFDQMSALYNHYTVIGSKFSVRAVPFTATSESWTMSLTTNDDTVTTNVVPLAQAEYSDGKVRLIPANTNSMECTMRAKWSAKKVFGGSILANDNLQGNSGANPAEQTYYQMALRSTDSASTVSVYCMVQIEYIAVWDELKDVAQS